MAKSEPNSPDDVKTTSENEQAAPVVEVPDPEMSAEEAAVLAHKGEAALHDIGNDGLEPPAPSDIPAPGDVVVPLDKTREAAQEAEKAAAPEKQEAEKSNKAPQKQARRNKAVTQEIQEVGAEDTRQEWEKPLSEVEPKKERKPRLEKQKPVVEKTEPAKEDAPAPKPEQPPELKEAPRKSETEQIVFINLSELHAFKNHPFQVRDDEEMRVMVENVKEKGKDSGKALSSCADYSGYKNWVKKVLEPLRFQDFLAEKEGFEPSKPFCGLHDFQTHPIIASTRRYDDYYFALLFYTPKNLFYFFKKMLKKVLTLRCA